MKVAKLKAHPWQIGEAYFIRTITHHYTGRLVAVFGEELVLEDAAWIADNGRFSEALATGTFLEVEPYPDNAQVIISRASLLDASVFIHSLPRGVK